MRVIERQCGWGLALLGAQARIEIHARLGGVNRRVHHSQISSPKGPRISGVDYAQRSDPSKSSRRLLSVLRQADLAVSDLPQEGDGNQAE